MAASITSKPYDWGPDHLDGLISDYADLTTSSTDASTKYNPTPGTLVIAV